MIAFLFILTSAVSPMNEPTARVPREVPPRETPPTPLPLEEEEEIYIIFDDEEDNSD